MAFFLPAAAPAVAAAAPGAAAGAAAGAAFLGPVGWGLLGVSALSSLLGGAQRKSEAKARELAARIEAENAKVRASQIGEQSRAQLATVLGNIDAIRTARGASLDSATGRAIRRRTMDDALRDEAIARLGEMNRAGAAGMAASGYRSAARWAMPMAVLGAAQQVGSGYMAMGGR